MRLLWLQCSWMQSLSSHAGALSGAECCMLLVQVQHQRSEVAHSGVMALQALSLERPLDLG